MPTSNKPKSRKKTGINKLPSLNITTPINLFDTRVIGLTKKVRRTPLRRKPK